MNDATREQMKQELLELHFGCHPDPDSLNTRLSQDPELRELQAEVQREATIMEEAASEAIPELSLEPAPAPEPSVRSWWSTPRFRVAASVLLTVTLAIPVANWQWRARHASNLATESVAMVVSGPRTAPDAAPATYSVQTLDHADEPFATRVSWESRDDTGRIVAEDVIQSDGDCSLTIPQALSGISTITLCALDAPDQPATTITLGENSRPPLVHLSTDKPLYRPGDLVRLRCVLLDRVSGTAVDGIYRLRLTNPREQTARSWFEKATDGVIAVAHPLGQDAPGGPWKFELQDAAGRFTVSSVQFNVREYQAPQLDTDLKLDRSSYAAGSEGELEIKVRRLGTSVDVAAAFASAQVSVIVDGDQTWVQEIALDLDGRSKITFPVPATVKRGDGRVVVRVQDRRIVETAVKTFTVPTSEVQVSLFPEGGDLVADTPVRVYAEVHDAAGRPVHAEGQIVDAADGSFVAPFKTLHEGRGRFEVTARRGQQLVLELTSPVTQAVSLPAVGEAAVSLRSKGDVTEPGAPIHVQVTSADPGPWIVAAFCRGHMVASTTLTGSGPHDVALRPDDHVAGVLRVTVFDRRLAPVAERLIRRRNAKSLQVEVAPARSTLEPGGKQELTLRVSDESGAPVAAVLGVTVRDQAVDARATEKHIGIADRAWLLGDVEPDALEDVEAFLTAGSDADRNVDLLLGTRGWRRFGWRDPSAFIAAHEDRARRLLVLEDHSATPLVTDTRPDTAAALFAARQESRRARTTAALTAAAILGAFGLWGIWRLLLSSAVRFGARQPRRATAMLMPAVVAVLAMAVILPLQQQPSADRLAIMPTDAAFSSGEDNLVMVSAALTVVPRPEGEAMLESVIAFTAGIRDLRMPLGMNASDRTTEDPGNLWFGASNTAIGMGIGGGARLGSTFFWADEAKTDEKMVIAPNAPASTLRVFQRAAPSWAREFAHARPTNAPPGDRTAFADVLYWHPTLRTNSEGEAAVGFQTGDQVTTWGVYVDAHGAGRVGQSLSTFTTEKSVTVDAKVPVAVTAGDLLHLPVTITAPEDASEATLTVQSDGAFTLDGEGRTSGQVTVALDRGEARVLLPIKVNDQAQRAALRIVADVSGARDSVLRFVKVSPAGFPRTRSYSGVAGPSAVQVVPSPDSVLGDSLRATLKMYPSPMSTLQDGMEGMLREPHGCFEQTSSANYPNVMAMRLMQRSGDGRRALPAQSANLLAQGYRRLTSFEVKGGGFDWYGRSPAHVALTAYGLVQFHDMSSVYDVDADLVRRTSQWLLSKRDGDGGFDHTHRGYGFGAAPDAVLDAYVTWALVTAGTDPSGLKAELDALEASASDCHDAYQLAVTACAMKEAGRTDAAKRFRDQLASMQDADGKLTGATRSVTASRGHGLAVETTSFAILAWLGHPEHGGSVRRALDWLLAQRNGNGTFGSTQATVMAMKAIVGYANSVKPQSFSGLVTITVNGQRFRQVPVHMGHSEAIQVDGLAAVLRSGNNVLEIEAPADAELPWALDMTYRSLQPADDPGCALDLQVSLRSGATPVAEGTNAAIDVVVTNLTDEGQANPTVVIGLPCGLEVTDEVLEDLKRSGTFAYYELRERDLVLYWDGIAPSASYRFTVDAVARVPGETRGDASRAWLYYEPNLERWAPPLQCRVTAIR